MAIWRIKSSSKYDLIYLVSEHDAKKIDFVGESVAAHWQPVPVIFAHRENIPRSDFPWLSTGLLICNDRILKIIQPTIANDVEILPLQCDEETLYTINVIPLIDALDPSHANLEYSPTGFVAIKAHAFKPEMIAGKTLFKIPQRPRTIYATSRFMTLIEAHGLTGIRIIKKVWEE
ncbi:MAG: hypothetical protein K8L97_13245 [Anaerolineae bacterium]|nr:hypothetical protein [Anaerolineae bacterium]